MAIEFLKPLYPPHPLEECEITLEINLRGEMARRVIEHAERLSRAPVELMADIVERVLADDLIDAVLDEGGDEE